MAVQGSRCGYRDNGNRHRDASVGESQQAKISKTPRRFSIMASEDSTQATGCRGGAAMGVARKALRMIALESWGGADCHGGGGRGRRTYTFMYLPPLFEFIPLFVW